MGADSADQPDETVPGNARNSSNVGLALALGVMAIVGAGLAVQQVMQKRLTRPEKARLKFYRYLRERGRLES